MLTWMTAGESHGPALVATLAGVPVHTTVSTAVIADALAERRLGYGRGARQKFEQDRVEILTGVRHGKTTGGPVTILIHNSEWPKWQTVMSPDPVSEEDLMVDAGKGDSREMARNRRLTRPRPGHADLAGVLSYRHLDARDVLERASARETAARVALGAVAKQILREACGAEIVGRVVAVGASTSETAPPTPADRRALRESPVRTTDPDAEAAFVAAIDAAAAAGDTVGGVAEVIAYGLPLGLGSHVSESQKLDARIASALMSIQSAKAVEVGGGFASTRTVGSRAHDAIHVGASGTLERASNQAGGIEGGTSNGLPIVARVGFKPIATVPRALPSVDLSTGEESSAFHQRSDTCQVVPGAVIAEAALALVLAQALTERFGGRSIEEVREQIELQRAYVQSRSTFAPAGAREERQN